MTIVVKVVISTGFSRDKKKEELERTHDVARISKREALLCAKFVVHTQQAFVLFVKIVCSKKLRLKKTCLLFFLVKLIKLFVSFFGPGFGL